MVRTDDRLTGVEDGVEGSDWSVTKVWGSDPVHVSMVAVEGFSAVYGKDGHLAKGLGG